MLKLHASKPKSKLKHVRRNDEQMRIERRDEGKKRKRSARLSNFSSKSANKRRERKRNGDGNRQRLIKKRSVSGNNSETRPISFVPRRNSIVILHRSSKAHGRHNDQATSKFLDPLLCLPNHQGFKHRLRFSRLHIFNLEDIGQRPARAASSAMDCRSLSLNQK